MSCLVPEIWRYINTDVLTSALSASCHAAGGPSRPDSPAATPLRTSPTGSTGKPSLEEEAAPNPYAAILAQDIAGQAVASSSKPPPKVASPEPPLKGATGVAGAGNGVGSSNSPSIPRCGVHALPDHPDLPHSMQDNGSAQLPGFCPAES